VTLVEILQALRRRWAVIAATTVVGLAIAMLLTLSRDSEFRAQSQVLLTQPQVAASGSDGQATQQKLIALSITYAEVVTAPGFVGDALAVAGIEVGDAQIDGDNPLNTSIVRITVTSSSAARTNQVTTAVTEGLRSFLNGTQSSVPEAARMLVEVIEEPSATETSANATLAAVVALLASVAIGSTGALLLENP
jgi:capsular polysaccharide biosynthesis protein